MDCHSCLVEELTYEIKVEGEQNLEIMLDVTHFLENRKIAVKSKENIISLKESDMQDFYDFCIDHMDSEGVFFRLRNQEWRPLTDFEKILEMQWIDEVIKKELTICYFQPIVNEKEEIFAYEILARFKKEDGSLIYPNVIFDAARNRGRLYALDRLCRMTAVRNAVVLKDKKSFINFIPTSIYSPEFCLRSTTQLANQLGVDPSQLVFEVVETEKVEDIDHLKRILAYYKEKGFQYALDDVGEGYSTMEVLEDIAPHYMKLDMKYVQGVASDSSKQQVALQFLQKSNEIGSTPLAEGVEQREDYEWLKQKGYQLFQGYLFGKPEPKPVGMEERNFVSSEV